MREMNVPIAHTGPARAENLQCGSRKWIDEDQTPPSRCAVFRKAQLNAKRSAGLRGNTKRNNLCTGQRGFCSLHELVQRDLRHSRLWLNPRRLWRRQAAAEFPNQGIEGLI